MRQYLSWFDFIVVIQYISTLYCDNMTPTFKKNKTTANFWTFSTYYICKLKHRQKLWLKFFKIRVCSTCGSWPGLYSRFWWDLHLSVSHQDQRTGEDNPQQHHQHTPSLQPTSVPFNGIPGVPGVPWTPAVHPCSCSQLHQSSGFCMLPLKERDVTRTKQIEF